ncbi:MAG TPA: glycosyltransferase family 2 protein [Thermoanaerobaculia bacterium]|nr:glycosyltransferase family 2 protein [Thermoanaerobaculia bacterium]
MAAVSVIVPARDAAPTIGRTLDALAKQDVDRPYEVIVVDDGSRDATADAARRNGAVVLRHAVNRGQGAALQTGIAYALRRGAEVIVTFDSDGQHAAEDVDALVAPLRAGRADVVLGSRFRGSTEGMTALRRIVLRSAVLFTRYASGARVTDTHNGLRAFTRAAAAKLDIRLDRMAHASEILDQIVQHRMRYEEVPVHVRYTAYSRRKGQTSLAALRILADYVLGRWMR